MTSAYNAALEAAAKVADAHKGSAAKKRHSRDERLSKFNEEAQLEIQAEERGEDIAAEMIAAAIRALPVPADAEGPTAFRIWDRLNEPPLWQYFDTWLEAAHFAEDAHYEPSDIERLFATPAPPAQVGEWQRNAVEKLCRAVCGVEGIDPDEDYHKYTDDPYVPLDPNWTRYAHEIEKVLNEIAPSAPAPDKLVEALEGFHSGGALMRSIKRMLHHQHQGLEIQLERACEKADAALSAHRSGGKTGEDDA